MLCASTVVSLLMDGFCCAFQRRHEPQRENDCDIDARAKYERQRLVRLELWRQKHEEVLGHWSDSTMQDKRRKELLLAKRMAKMKLTEKNAINASERQRRTQSSPARRITSVHFPGGGGGDDEQDRRWRLSNNRMVETDVESESMVDISF